MLKSLVLLCFVSSATHAASWREAWTVKPAAPEPNALLIGYAMTLTSLGLRYPLGEDLQRDQSTRQPLGRYSRVGDYAGRLIPNALYVGGELIAASFGAPRAGRRAQLMTMATLESALITTALKYTIREDRPNHSARNGFPSGHSTTIFAFAAIVGAEHGWAYGVPAYVLAAFTGWSRINDNAHYLHQVLAGATVGVSVGLGVHLANQGPTARVVRITPLFIEDGLGLAAAANW